MVAAWLEANSTGRDEIDDQIRQERTRQDLIGHYTTAANDSKEVILNGST